MRGKVKSREQREMKEMRARRIKEMTWKGQGETINERSRKDNESVRSLPRNEKCLDMGDGEEKSVTRFKGEDKEVLQEISNYKLSQRVLVAPNALTLVIATVMMTWRTRAK